MRAYKNGVTHYGADDIDAFFGNVPAPLRDGMPVVVQRPSGHRAHVALDPLAERAICGVAADGQGVRRYDLADEKFSRRGFRCRKCFSLAPTHGIEFTR
jgi:hypothetical protein